LAKSIRQLGGDKRGAVAVLFALSSTVLIGFAGLGAEVALWYIAKRTAQGAADTAAYSAVVADRVSNDFAVTAKAIAAQYGFVDGNVVVNRPPLSGPYSSNGNAIEVVISAPQIPLFSKLFAAAPTVAARAVGLSGIAGVSLVE
jgi:Flp pilus assembly protein TadG